MSVPTGHRPREGVEPAMTEELLATLRSRISGGVITPADPEYDEARAVWNGMVDRRPAAIARCADTGDVVAAVDLARERRLVVSVRGGGHNVSGNAVCDGGLVIDLSPMKAIETDPSAGTVQAGGGVTIGELDADTQRHGLAVPMGVVTETGIAGLTLSGGAGWLRRKHGLSIDNLLSAEVVTPDGQAVHASPDSEPELFWALRGGGGNFGIVTSFKFRAHPVGPEVAFAFVVHHPEGAGSVLREFRSWTAGARDDISAFAILWHIPEMDGIPSMHHHQPGVVLLAMHAGPPDVGEAELRPLRDLGTPVADLSSRMNYLEVQRFFDEDYPAHVMRYYWKSLYLLDLDDAAVDLLITLNERAPSPHSTLDIWQLGGAVGRVAAGDTAFGERSSPFLLGIEANWEDPQGDADNLAWAREVHAAMQPYSNGAEYLNFPGFHEDAVRSLHATFGENYGRLVAAKTTYDPGNLLRLNANIPPAPAHA